MSDKAAPPPQQSSPWLQRLDLALVLLILVFVTLVLVNTVSSVPQVWPYLLVSELHNQVGRLGLALAVLMLVLAVYIGIIRKGDVTPLFRRATYIIFGTVLAQALVGLGMYGFFNARPAEDVHLIYGMGTVLSLPFFIFVETTAKKRPAMGSYIWGFALLAGIILRSIVTGS